MEVSTSELLQDSEFLYNSRIEQDIAEIRSEKQRLEGEIQKYERLKQTLDLLPNELSWELPHIPLTKHALLPNATLVNTNEVTVHIGDNWFTRCSAHHAKGICTRRQQKCKETISALDQREKMLLSWQNAARSKAGRIAGGQEDSLADEQELAQSGAFAKEEITEFVTEEQYLADKETHRQNVKEHYVKKREIREKLASQVSEDELWQRLEELEMEEQTSGELRTMDRSVRSGAPAREIPPKKKKGGVRFADDIEKEEEEVAPPKLNFEPDESGTVKLGWSWDDGESSSDEESSSNESQTKTDDSKQSPPRRLSFAQHLETGSDETSVIEFTHTPVECVPSTSTKVQLGELKSPSDIYTNFHEMFAAAATPPKSILKQSKAKEEAAEEWPAISYPFSYIKGDLPSSDSDYEVEDELPAQTTSFPEVLCDIVEKAPVPPVIKAVEFEQQPEAIEKDTPSEAKEASSAERSVRFKEPAAQPDKSNQKRGKKMSKFKSSRMTSKGK